ncbi:MAG: SpoIIE family protein phosphatase [Bacteroidales bacterium]|nr:SpoIIE family protein phosphatase [Bacteroidales bacterium]
MDHKILLINIEQQSSEKIEFILKNEFPFVKIDSVENSGQVLNYLNKINPDIVLYDFDLPENELKENLELLEIISKKYRLPVIALSSSENHSLLFKSGAVNFIHKPYIDITLISNINTAINLTGILRTIDLKEKIINEKDQRIQFQIKNELKQREVIITKNKEIMADIRYASRIQHAILPQLEQLEESFHEYFILHQPKRHISGDFYWAYCNGTKKIVAVGDCTGHGVSGALMHMLGNAYLNEIVAGNKYKTASDILEQLREHVMQSLNQTGESGETQDGMDIALCIIDCENKKLEYAGANNPIYIIREKELTEFRGDRMPVGIHINFSKPYTNHIINLESMDQIYLFSDGYADQFGGPRGKKFRYKQFKEMLIENSHEPMNIQKEILNNVHDKWRGQLEQIDDILVFGLKIK